MVRIQTDLPYTSLVARSCAPMASSPRILNRRGTVRRRSYAKSPCRSSSSLRVLRRQGAAKHKLARRQAAKLCYRFGPLTPFCALREPDRSDGTKNGFPAPNKEPTTNQKLLLDRKSPIQVRIRFPPAESHANSRSQGGSRRGRCGGSRRPELRSLLHLGPCLSSVRDPCSPYREGTE